MKGFCWTNRLWFAAELEVGVSRRDRPCVAAITFGSPALCCQAMRPQMRPCARLPQTDMINAPTSVWDSIVCAGSDREKESEQLKREHRWRASHYSNASSTGPERAVLSQCCCGAIVKTQRRQLEWNRPRLQPTQPKPSAQNEKHPLLSSDQKMFRLVLFNMSQWLSSELNRDGLGVKNDPK